MRISKKKRIEEVIYTLPQAPFFLNKCSKNRENMRISKKKTYKRGHLYSAAGAFFPKRCSTNHEKYENF